MKVTMIHGAKSWMSSPTHPNYAAAARAIEKVFGCAPDYTREGGSIPITTAMEEATGMNVLLLPVGACDDMAHSQNEKYNISNLMNGSCHSARRHSFSSTIFSKTRLFLFLLPCSNVRS
jgi:acetylornithine deacetylase/succinyl-diaminopimelate desuccinylase-like protein